MKVENQIAVITGGSSGMGRSCAELLMSRGARVVVWDIHDCSLECETVICDVRSAESIEFAMNATIEHFGIPQICIQCAGIAPAQRMTGKQGIMPLASFTNVIDVNLVGTFNVMRVIAHAMSQLPSSDDNDERGVIINTASISAFEGQIGQTAYSASKAGIVGMTLPAARELAQYSIRVNTIAPGLIGTPLLQAMPKPVQDSLIAGVTYPKRFGHPQEFAALAIHLIENQYINGEVIRLDGALRMPAR
jgi:NAD(P)-dependent dehydrogenase (short-subunit alcohol dehydrogenase family)